MASRVDRECLICHAVLIVGFESGFSRVDEDVGSHELCVRIFTQAALLPTHTNFTFSLDLFSVPGTAGILYLVVTNLAIHHSITIIIY